MKYFIIAFKSRNNVQMFAKILRNNFIQTEIVNTPKSISISCGLSIKTSHNNLSMIIKLLQASNLSDCLGIFTVERFGLKELIQKLY